MSFQNLSDETHIENISGVEPLFHQSRKKNWAARIFSFPAFLKFLFDVAEVFDVCLITQNDRYTVGGEDTFDTLTDLVEFYKRVGIEEISGNWVYFKQVNVCALVVELHSLF